MGRLLAVGVEYYCSGSGVLQGGLHSPGAVVLTPITLLYIVRVVFPELVIRQLLASLQRALPT